MSAGSRPAIGVLVVDDQEDVRFLIRTVIEGSDAGVYVAGEAASLEEALDLLRAGGVAVALVDAVIPPRDDLEVARLVREQYPDLPVVVWSADVTREIRERAAALGIDACIDKADVQDTPAVLRAVAERT